MYIYLTLHSQTLFNLTFWDINLPYNHPSLLNFHSEIYSYRTFYHDLPSILKNILTFFIKHILLPSILRYILSIQSSKSSHHQSWNVFLPYILRRVPCQPWPAACFACPPWNIRWLYRTLIHLLWSQSKQVLLWASRLL